MRAQIRFRFHVYRLYVRLNIFSLREFSITILKRTRVNQLLIVRQMSSRVNFQFSLILELFIALGAAERFFSVAMGLFDVILKRLLVRVNFRAVIAWEKLRWGVNFLVMLKLSAGCESWAAMTENLRGWVVVLASVSVEEVKGLEIFVADVTDEAKKMKN